MISQVIKQIKFIKCQSNQEESSNNDEEFNKQEENILKIFTTQSIDSSSSIRSVIILFFHILPAIFSLVFVILWMNYFRNSGDILIQFSPHLMTTSSSYYCLFSTDTHFHVILFTKN
jgi:hypothetical protein